MSKTIDMERKVTKFGNSLGISMTDALKQIGLGLGDTVHIDIKETEGEIIIRKVNKVILPVGLDKQFIETLSQVISEYDDTLRGLKDR